MTNKQENITLSVDLGSSAFKLILFSSLRGQIYFSEFSFSTQYRGDKVEHQPTEIWEELKQQLSSLLIKLEPKDKPKYLSISTQRESVLVWDKNTLSPLSPIISWQDRRTDSYISSLKKEIINLIRSKTGLWVSSYCSAPKLRYLYKEVISNLDAEWAWGTLDCWLIYLLSEGKYYVTDYVSASRTALLNLKTLEWDEELCSCFNLPISKLPALCENDREIGTINLFGKHNLIIKGVIGDQQGALYSTYRLRKDKNKLPISVVYGTGTFLLKLLPSNKTFEEIYNSLPEGNPLSISLAWVLKNKTCFALEIGLTNSGKALEWFLKLVKWKVEDLKKLLDTEIIDWKTIPLTIPTLSNTFLLSSPDNYSSSISNLGYETTDKEIIISFLESLSYSVRVALEFLDFDQKKNYIVAGGGIRKNDFFLKLQSSSLNCPITIYQSEHLSILGSILLTFEENIEPIMEQHKVIDSDVDYFNVLNKRFLDWKNKLNNSLVI